MKLLNFGERHVRIAPVAFEAGRVRSTISNHFYGDKLSYAGQHVYYSPGPGLLVPIMFGEASPVRSTHPQLSETDASATAVVQPDGYKLGAPRQRVRLAWRTTRHRQLANVREPSAQRHIGCGRAKVRVKVLTRTPQCAQGVSPSHCRAARIWRARALAMRRMCSNSVKWFNSDSCSRVNWSCFDSSSNSSARCCAAAEGWKSTTVCGVVPDAKKSTI